MLVLMLDQIKSRQFIMNWQVCFRPFSFITWNYRYPCVIVFTLHHPYTASIPFDLPTSSHTRGYNNNSSRANEGTCYRNNPCVSKHIDNNSPHANEGICYCNDPCVSKHIDNNNFHYPFVIGLMGQRGKKSNDEDSIEWWHSVEAGLTGDQWLFPSYSRTCKSHSWKF